MSDQGGKAGTAKHAVGFTVVVLVWCVVTVALMVTDVWDESRALNLFEEYGLAELISSNWRPAETEGLTLFRPLPMLFFSIVAAVVHNPEITWRLLRGVNAVLLLASGALLLNVIRRLRGIDYGRDITLSVAFLFSGSALITASWFANGFDAMALFFISFGTYELCRNRGWVAGIALGLAFFCKEVALLSFPFLLVMAWTNAFQHRETKKALSVAAAFLLVYLFLRSAVVAPGSSSDLRQFSSEGVLVAFLRLPVTFWFQAAAVPAQWLGVVSILSSLALMRKWQATVGMALLYGFTAILYGPILYFGPSPLISSSNFIGRLFLVPAAFALVLVGVFARRYACLILLIPILLGGGITVDRHLRFQKSYLSIYQKAASVEIPPLYVHSRLYATRFEYKFRQVVIGRFPKARWVFRSDGTLVHRKHLRGPRPAVSANRLKELPVR